MNTTDTPSDSQSGRRTYVVAAVLAALAGLLAGSCVTQQPTLPPVRVPAPPMILDRLGDYRRDVATDSEEARRWFDQGMALMLGYNFDGAIACFRQATAIDPGFAMAWWGIGYSGGPNQNNPGIDKPKDITRPIIERYQRHLFYHRKKDGTPLSFRTQGARLVPVRAFFKYLARENWILYNPAAEIELPRPERRLPKAVMTAEEAEAAEAARREEADKNGKLPHELRPGRPAEMRTRRAVRPR